MSVRNDYDRDGYLTGVSFLDAAQAQRHRDAFEGAEAQRGALHYKAKMHTVLPEALELATHPAVLDYVEQLLGPDILLYDSTYIVKEPQSPSFVSWHQDLTYWGLSHDDQVTLWLALSPANGASGCMRMIPGSHKHGRFDHETSDDASNVLFQSQTVTGVDEDSAVLCELEPGQASFHHGWTLHASMPNKSDDRRIGFNVQYLAPHVRQTKHDKDTALLVRGEDKHSNFRPDQPANGFFEPEATKVWEELNQLHITTQGTS